MARPHPGKSVRVPVVHHSIWRVCGIVAWLGAASLPLVAQGTTPAPGPQQPGQPAPAAALPKDYVIGAEDLLNIVFWTAKEMSSEALVRPDGKISLPLINDIAAAGLTPLQLADEIKKAATKFVRDADATVMVREIRSRKFYVVGEVAKPGPFQLGSEMTVLQAIGEAGGFIEGANKGDITIVRTDNGRERRFKFNYNDVVRGKNTQQNIRLLPGDTILVR